MPIIWNGNGLNADILKPEFRKKGDAYAEASDEEKLRREAQITAFLRHNIEYIKQLDPVNALTVGTRSPSGSNLHRAWWTS